MPPVSVQCHNIYLSLHGACVAILTVVSLLHLTCVHLHMYNSVDTYEHAVGTQMLVVYIQMYTKVVTQCIRTR